MGRDKVLSAVDVNECDRWAVYSRWLPIDRHQAANWQSV